MMTAFGSLEALGFWAAVRPTFASKLAASWNEISFVKKISRRIRITCRFVSVLHSILQSPSFIILHLLILILGRKKNAPEITH